MRKVGENGRMEGKGGVARKKRCKKGELLREEDRNRECVQGRYRRKRRKEKGRG